MRGFSFTERNSPQEPHRAAAPPELLPEGAADAAGGAAAKGPILFYTGNESPVEVYINNTGLMWDLAPKLNALLVFAEHRYEGESFPELQGGPPLPLHAPLSLLAAHHARARCANADGGARRPPGTPDCMAHCTSAEALADFASLITTMKQELGATSAPVVAFGGSYGGMLSSWFRIKYPNIIAGAIAASAPIWVRALASFPPRSPSCSTAR